MMNVTAHQQEIIEASIESCLRVIAGAEAGKEEQIFSEWSRHAVKHAREIGWEKDAIVDRLDNAGQAIGLDADLRQEILGEAFAVDEIVAGMEREEKRNSPPALPPLDTLTPAAWKGTEPIEQRWLAHMRIPSGDLTLYSGNGGAGKTETAVQLLLAAAANLGDWLGCIVEGGPALLLSCEEPESNIRDRAERICKHRAIDPHAIENLHLHFPDLENTWLATADRNGRVTKTPLMLQVESWIAANKPRLVVIDSIAAVFDGEAISRRQVRTFLGMLRKIAREHDTAIVLLDHPSVRGMSDGSGTANSVDWRNSVRSMLHLSDPEKSDQDARELEVKKNNYGRSGEKVKLRWNGLTFVTDNLGAGSPYKAAAEREIDEMFLRLLDKRNAQARPVRPNKGRGYAPAELAEEPEAKGTSADALAAAMGRLYDTNQVVTVMTGPPSRQISHIERVAAA